MQNYRKITPTSFVTATIRVYTTTIRYTEKTDIIHADAIRYREHQYRGYIAITSTYWPISIYTVRLQRISDIHLFR